MDKTKQAKLGKYEEIARRKSALRELDNSPFGHYVIIYRVHKKLFFTVAGV